MTREDIIRMAGEAQMPFYWRTGEITYLDKLERFSALVSSAERESCAKLCEQYENDMGYGQPQKCADAIRARGTSMTKDEALKMALKAFEWNYNTDLDNIPACEKWAKMLKENITAIKEALAQPAVTESHKQEPVTWRYKIVDVFGRPAWTLKTPKSDTRVLESQPLYTTPPPVAEPHKRKPLTDEEIILIVAECASSHQHTDIHLARAIEAAVWEKQK